MDSVFRLPEAELGGAKTHVIVIGIGDYFFMRPAQGAEEAMPGGAIALQAMRRLTSPQVSATAFGHWVEKQKWIQPLGSLRVAIGSAPYVDSAGASFDVPGGTMAELQKLISDWSRDVARHKDNVAIFYFCGHGEMHMEDSLVMTQDFGDENEPFWSRAINVSEFVRRMRQIDCKNQIYFIDACRVGTEKWVEYFPQDARPIISGGPRKLAATPPIIFSAKPDEAAFGVNNQLSVFTKGLLKLLDGYTATRKSPNRPWVTTQSSICTAILEIRDHVFGNDSVTPDGTALSVDPLFQVDTPRVVIQLDTNPATLLRGQVCNITSPSGNTIPIGPAIPPVLFESVFGKHHFGFTQPFAEQDAIPPSAAFDLP